ncbi:hypothetical protein ACWELO_35735 [Streptomyces sp. NPDC004596]
MGSADLRLCGSAPSLPVSARSFGRAIVDGVTQPLETWLVEELGPDIRQQLDGLKAKGWILAREAADGMMVVGLTGPAWRAVRSRRDVGRLRPS